MDDRHRTRDSRLHATVTWSVPILTAVVPVATFLAVGLWGLAGAGLVLAVVVLAALVGALRPPGVVAGLASGVVLAVGTSLAGLVLLFASIVVRS